MRGRIGRTEITNPHVVQLVVIGGAVLLFVNAWLLVTHGRSYPGHFCAPAWEPPGSWLRAGVRFGVGLGFLAAALRHPFEGMRVRDPLTEPLTERRGWSACR